MQTVASRPCGQGLHADKEADNVAVLVIKMFDSNKSIGRKQMQRCIAPTLLCDYALH